MSEQVIVPKKFAKIKKSFLNKIIAGSNVSNLGTFCAFPQAIAFHGQDSGENVVLLMRKHPAKFVIQYMIILALLISPLLLGMVFKSFGSEIGFGLTLGVGLLMFLFAVSYTVDTFFKWYYSINIITDKRIVDVDFTSILFHRFSEAPLDKIEDVSHAPVGILSSLFDFGDVYIQTAGTRPEFEFDGVPKPRVVQDTLLDLLEMKRKGVI